jgi:hypothetical protein
MVIHQELIVVSTAAFKIVNVNIRACGFMCGERRGVMAVGCIRKVLGVYY